MAVRSAMEPDIERSLGTDFARDSPRYRQYDTERPSSPMTLISPAGDLKLTVTLISYWTTCSHNPFFDPLCAVYTVVALGSAFGKAQLPAYTRTTESPSLVLALAPRQAVSVTHW